MFFWYHTFIVMDVYNCFRVILMYGRHVFVIASIIFLLGCPTQYEQFEEYYFQDQFINAVLEIQPESLSYDVERSLQKFLARNGARLKGNLIDELSQFNAGITEEDVKRLHDFINALDSIEQLFPEESSYLDKKVLVDLARQAIELYSSKKEIDIPILMANQRYRQAFESLQLLQNQRSLNVTQNNLHDALALYLKRHVVFQPIRIHDKPIESFKDEAVEDHWLNYISKGETLLSHSINVPEEFLRHFEHHFNKEKSDYFFLHKSDSKADNISYSLAVSIGIEEQESLVEERRVIEDEFLMKFDVHSDWQRYPISYELFVDTVTYTASIDAAVYLPNQKLPIAHYVFEVRYPVDDVRMGDFLDFPNHVIEVTQSQRYKSYNEGSIIRDPGYYVEEVLDDLAHVFVIKLLNTIDQDPDPYAIATPFHIKK